MYKSIRYETCRHPYWEMPVQKEQKEMTRRHRSTVKNRIKIALNNGEYEEVNFVDRQKGFYGN